MTYAKSNSMIRGYEEFVSVEMPTDLVLTPIFECSDLYAMATKILVIAH